LSTIGILALQGDFEAHEKAFQEAGARTTQVRRASDLEGIDGLVIPGGESTTMLKLIHAENLWDALKSFGESKPVFATCAGAILLARHVTNPDQDSLGTVDIDVQRNAYGRQIHSAVAKIPTSEGEMEAVFIRAPIIRRAGPGVNVLARYNGDPVLVEQGRHLVATFHPELSRDRSVQRLFLSKI
jgi:5'-phosphate synthase pdxT subunit